MRIVIFLRYDRASPPKGCLLPSLVLFTKLTAVKRMMNTSQLIRLTKENSSALGSTTNYLISTVLCVILLIAGTSHILAQDYYVDPLNGNMAHAGTAEQPWSTLEAVFAAKKSFAGGDKIFLRRGNHGGPVIHGSGASAESRITILAEAGHAPIMKWVMFSGASFWTLENIFVNSEVPGDTKALDALKESGLITLTNKSHDNIIRTINACSTQYPLGWEANETGWNNGAKNGIFVTPGGGGNNRFEKVFCLNVHNGICNCASDNVYAYNVVENYIIDGVRPMAPNFKFHYNIVMNSIMNDHTKGYGSRQHRDMWQAIGSLKDNHEAIGNIFAAIGDPSLIPLICSYKETSATKYMEACAPVFAGWDGPFTNIRFENNVIYTDHQTGIWFNGASNCRIVNNTLAGITGASRGPTIRIGQKKAGDGILSTATNIVYNNITAAPLELQNADKSTTVSGSGNNLVVKSPKFFLALNLHVFDLHLSGSATTAINAANPAFAPALDADENKRTAPDIGAYEMGKINAPDTTPPSAPGKPRVIIIPGLGADLEWKESVDNRKVMGYDIYRGKDRVGRVRNVTRFFDVFTGTTATLKEKEAAITYTIRAFDMSGNGTISPVGKVGK